MRHAFFVVLVFVFGLCSSVQAADQKESAFERVNRTGVIRCGYFT